MKKLATEEKISLIWVVVMINMIFNDIYSIVLEIAEGGAMELPADGAIVMSIAAILTNIPTFMILLSRILPLKANRVVNIAAAAFTIIYVVGGGSLLPHYIIVAAVEVVLCIIIIVIAAKWRAIAPEAT